MVLNNYLYILRSNTYNGTSQPCVALTGATQTMYFPSMGYDFFYSPYVSNSNNTAGWKVQVGSSNTAPTASDYAITTTGLTRVSTTANSCASVSQLRNITSVYQNSTESAITVNEVGLSCGIYNSSNTKEVLFFRKVLSTPVTIQPGEQYAFTYTVSFNI